MFVHDIDYSRKKTKSGMEVVIAPLPESPTITAIILFKAGSRDEIPQQSGISHFLEHMVFKGNKNYQKPKEVASAIESLGGSFNAFTSKENTVFYVKVGSDFLPIALKWLSSLVSAPLIRKKDVDSERGVILEEINMYNDTPMRQVGDYFEGLLLSGTTLGRSIIGNKKTLSGMSALDLKKYHQENYHPSNAVFVVAGNLKKSLERKKTTEKFFSEIEKHFSQLPKPKKEEKANIVFPKRKGDSKARVKVVYKKTDQTHLVLGAKTFSLFDKRRYPLLLLNTILGGGMSSRVFCEIREKRGLAYYVNSGMHLYKDTGYLAVNAGVNNEKLEQAIREIKKVYRNIEQKLVSVSELKKAKDQVIGSMLLERETSDDIAFLLGSEIISQGEFMPFSQEIKIIKKISREDLRKVAREFLSAERLHLALIGPWKTSYHKKFEKLI